MKKIYLLWVLLFSVFVVNAQVFRLSYIERESGDSLVFDNVCHVLLDSDEDFNATFIYFENISGQEINYRVQLTEKIFLKVLLFKCVSVVLVLKQIYLMLKLCKQEK